MSIFDFLFKASPEAKAREAEHQNRVADIQNALRGGTVPTAIRERLEGVRSARLPWTATLTPAELLIARSHGLRPLAAIAATCWWHYGWSWTNGHAEGWGAALKRLREEAKVVGANAVLDVKMRTIPLGVRDSMDFSLVGTAVRVEGLPPSEDPIIATVPALEFVKLLEADVVPTGIAIGAHYEWMSDWQPTSSTTSYMWRNIEARQLSQLFELVRLKAHAQLRAHAKTQGNGVLAHLNFSQMLETENPKQYLARHIVVATTVDAKKGAPFPHEVKIVVDAHAGGTPLNGTERHHQSYATNRREGAI